LAQESADLEDALAQESASGTNGPHQHGYSVAVPSKQHQKYEIIAMIWVIICCLLNKLSIMVVIYEANISFLPDSKCSFKLKYMKSLFIK